MKILLPSQPLRIVTGKLIGPLILALTLTNCTSGTVETAGPTPPSTSYSGTMVSVTLTTNDPATNPTGQSTINALISFSLSISESGTVTGVVAISDTATNCFSGGPISGNVTGSSITGTITDGIAGAISISGTVDSTNLSGVYSTTGNITSTTETGSSGETRTVYAGCPAHSGSIEAAA